MSPLTTWAPAVDSFLALADSGLRVSPRTCQPSAIRWRATAPPWRPVAPQTTMVLSPEATTARPPCLSNPRDEIVTDTQPVVQRRIGRVPGRPGGQHVGTIIGGHEPGPAAR